MAHAKLQRAEGAASRNVHLATWCAVETLRLTCVWVHSVGRGGQGLLCATSTLRRVHPVFDVGRAMQSRKSDLCVRWRLARRWKVAQALERISLCVWMWPLQKPVERGVCYTRLGALGAQANDEPRPHSCDGLVASNCAHAATIRPHRGHSIHWLPQTHWHKTHRRRRPAAVRRRPVNRTRMTTTSGTETCLRPCVSIRAPQGVGDHTPQGLATRVQCLDGSRRRARTPGLVPRQSQQSAVVHCWNNGMAVLEQCAAKFAESFTSDGYGSSRGQRCSETPR